MTFGDWAGESVNWVFTAIGLAALYCGWRVVTSRNVVHAALFLVGALACSAGLFLLLSAEFVAWALVLVYIGAVIVLLLFGIMITRAPTGLDESLASDKKAWPAVLAATTFALTAWASVDAFGATLVARVGEPAGAEAIGESLLGRFVIAFEAVSFVLLAALIGGITLARRDLTPAEEEERATV